MWLNQIKEEIKSTYIKHEILNCTAHWFSSIYTKINYFPQFDFSLASKEEDDSVINEEAASTGTYVLL